MNPYKLTPAGAYRKGLKKGRIEGYNQALKDILNLNISNDPSSTIVIEYDAFIALDKANLKWLGIE